ncbi:MAG: carbohydrate porin [Vampirovibrionales bacterium]|nr:carbohydrate porin [Vampirovibrionales bacterium]
MKRFWYSSALLAGSLSILSGLSALAAPSPYTGLDELMMPATEDNAPSNEQAVGQGKAIHLVGTPQGNLTPQGMNTVLTALVNVINRDLQRLDETKANKEEVETLKALQQALSGNLSQVAVQTNALTGKLQYVEGENEEQNRRLKMLEKTQIHGDATVGFLSDIGSKGVGGDKDGIRDAMTAIGRLRLTVDVPVREDREDSKWGAGNLHTRLIAAFGRFSPLAVQEGNSSSTYYPFNLYSRISTDVSGFNEGLGTGSVAGNNSDLNKVNGVTYLTRPNVYMESLFFKQKLKQGVPVLTSKLPFLPEGENWKTSGDLYAGLFRWWDIFDVSPYRGNELEQFQNNAFINIPGIAVNNNMPMAAYSYHQGLGEHASFDFSTAVGSPDVGDLMNAFNLTYEGKLNYTTAFLGEAFSKPGSLYLGGYNSWAAGNRNIASNISSLTNRSGGAYPNLLNTGASSSFYAGWNQEWFRGIGTNVGYLLNDTSPNLVSMTTMQPGPALVAAAAKQSFTSVLSIPVSALFPGHRESDVIGLGYAFVDIADGGYIGKQGMEHVGEAYYKFQAAPGVTIVPSVQLIANRLGIPDNGLVTILGLRVNYAF